MNPSLFVVMGVAGAGKSLIGAEFARAIGVDFVDGDDFHSAGNVAKMAAGIPLTDDDRAAWLRTLGDKLRVARGARRGLVVACSALKRKYRDQLRRDAGGPLQLVYLRGTQALIAERLAHRRGHFMPVSMLESQLATLEEPGADEHAWVVDVAGQPEAIVRTLVTLAQGGSA